MEFEFDKEMDALLRQAARGESVSVDEKNETTLPDSPHLDADEISLFAENALSEKTKTLYAAHLADCRRCRKILANVVAARDFEIAEKTAAAPQTSAVAAFIPWYKRLFAAPKLVFSLGALLVVFAGLIGFTIRQSSEDSRNTEVARVEPTEKLRGPSADSATSMSEANQSGATSGGSSMSNGGAADAKMSNSAAAPNVAGSMSNLSAKAAPPVFSGSAGSAMSTNTASVSNSAVASSGQGARFDEAPKSEPEKIEKAANDDKFDSNNAGAKRKSQPPDNENAPAASADQSVLQSPPAPKPAAPPARSAPAELPVNGRMTNEQKNARARRLQPADIRAAGGKTFRRENGVWLDAAYSGQATTNIVRGSAEFKKLDGGLRSIAASLSGAVVVVYNGKAYRIQ